MSKSDRASVLARFWARVNKGEAPHTTLGSPCWLWTGCLSPSGYGMYWDGESRVRVQRFAYEAEVGPVGRGLVLDHLCRIRHCVNPAHLEPVTWRENIMRGESFSSVNAQKTHCPKGHPLSGDNLRLLRDKPTGAFWRTCRTCIRERARARYARAKSSSLPPTPRS